MVRERVIDALAEVYDPELDEPITSLRFVSSCEVSPEGDVEVVLRLPDAAVRSQFRIPDGGRRAQRRAPAAGDRTGDGHAG